MENAVETVHNTKLTSILKFVFGVPIVGSICIKKIFFSAVLRQIDECICVVTAKSAGHKVTFRKSLLFCYFSEKCIFARCLVSLNS